MTMTTVMTTMTTTIMMMTYLDYDDLLELVIHVILSSVLMHDVMTMSCQSTHMYVHMHMIPCVSVDLHIICNSSCIILVCNDQCSVS